MPRQEGHWQYRTSIKAKLLWLPALTFTPRALSSFLTNIRGAVTIREREMCQKKKEKVFSQFHVAMELKKKNE